ncbi:hypothetical protein D1872_256650 [compost metagenome]
MVVRDQQRDFQISGAFPHLSSIALNRADAVQLERAFQFLAQLALACFGKAGYSPGKTIQTAPSRCPENRGTIVDEP